MFMSKGLVKLYPECANLLQHLPTGMKSQPKVLAAYIFACTAETQRGDGKDAEKLARRSLVWAPPPEIIVVQYPIRPPVRGAIVSACGFENSLLPNQVHLEVIDVWFDAFETCGDSDRNKNAHRLTTTVLHETVHWVREQANAADEITDDFGTLRFAADEAGEVFEKVAFDSRVCTLDELKAARMS